MLFSDTLTAEEKKRILSEKYGITLTEREAERMANMGGLGDGIERRAIEKGIEKGKAFQKIETANSMHSLGLSDNIIAASLKITEDEVKQILSKKKSDIFI